MFLAALGHRCPGSEMKKATQDVGLSAILGGGSSHFRAGRGRGSQDMTTERGPQCLAEFVNVVWGGSGGVKREQCLPLVCLQCEF